MLILCDMSVIVVNVLAIVVQHFVNRNYQKNGLNVLTNDEDPQAEVELTDYHNSFCRCEEIRCDVHDGGSNIQLFVILDQKAINIETQNYQKYHHTQIRRLSIKVIVNSVNCYTHYQQNFNAEGCKLEQDFCTTLDDQDVKQVKKNATCNGETNPLYKYHLKFDLSIDLLLNIEKSLHFLYNYLMTWFMIILHVFYIQES